VVAGAITVVIRPTIQTTTPQGALVTIYRHGQHSDIWVWRWMLPRPLSAQAAAVWDLVERYGGGGSGSDYFHLRVPRGREDEAVNKLLAVEAMDPMPSHLIGSRSLKEMCLWHNPDRPAGVLSEGKRSR
jgi:hypothetical protein